MSEPLDRLLSFFNAIAEWDTETYPFNGLDREDPIQQALREKKDQIYDEYCTGGARLSGYGASSPPKYSDMEPPVLVEESETKVVFKTGEKRYRSKCDFVMRYKAGKWMVAETLSVDWEGKLSRGYL